MKEEIKRNLLIVNSRDKVRGTTSDFTYNLGENSLEIEAIALKQASIPHTYTNINDTNNTFTIEDGGEVVIIPTRVATITWNSIVYELEMGGIYENQNEFIKAFNESDSGVSEVIQLSYNSGLNRYVITVIDNGDVGNCNMIPPISSFADIWAPLGFVTPIPIATFGTVITATNAPVAPFNVTSSTEYTVTVPTGQYDFTSLIAALPAAISAAMPLGSWTVVITGGKANISSTAYSWKFSNNLEDIPHMLGYEPSNMTYDVQHIALGVPDFYGTRYLYVASNTLANGYNAIQKNGSKTSILGAIPVCSSQGGMDKWEQPYLVLKKYDQSININEFDIQILDDNNNVVDLQSADVVLVFEIWATVRL
jgi:hypothetical protein